MSTLTYHTHTSTHGKTQTAYPSAVNGVNVAATSPVSFLAATGAMTDITTWQQDKSDI